MKEIEPFYVSIVRSLSRRGVQFGYHKNGSFISFIIKFTSTNNTGMISLSQKPLFTHDFFYVFQIKVGVFYFS